MVTDDERDYMYAEYAKDPRMKANIGIRRRLAPLLDNDRNQLELFTALLLSLPGSPVMYYGDEIGMGDNIWLGDRDGVRTPMQWTPDRNGGFSSSDPQRLYLPPVMDPIYGYQSLNVEAQQRTPQSLLHWTRRMIEIRKRHPVFGLGAYEELTSSNPSVLAFVREHDAASTAASGAATMAPPGTSTRPTGSCASTTCRGSRSRSSLTCAGSWASRLSSAWAASRSRRLVSFRTCLPYPGHGFYWFQLPPPREDLER